MILLLSKIRWQNKHLAHLVAHEMARANFEKRIT